MVVRAAEVFAYEITLRYDVDVEAYGVFGNSTSSCRSDS
jgi:hypothetical protein